MTHVPGNDSLSVYHAALPFGIPPNERDTRMTIYYAQTGTGATNWPGSGGRTTRRPPLPADGAAAYALLAAHRFDPDEDGCGLCQVSGTCRPAEAATERLAALGLPTTAPVPAPVPTPPPNSAAAANRAPAADRTRSAQNTWRGWLRPGDRQTHPRTNRSARPPMFGALLVRNSPLLTYGWRYRLGLVGLAGSRTRPT